MSKKRKMVIGVAVVVVGILIGSVWMWAEQNNTSKSAPLPCLKIDLILSEPPPLNATANITMMITPYTNLSAPSSLHAEIVFPEGYGNGFEWINGTRSWNGNLSKNVPVTLEGTIKAVKTGNWTIASYVASLADKTGNITFSPNFDGDLILRNISGYYKCIYISVSENSAYISDTPFPEYKPSTEQEFNETYTPAPQSPMNVNSSISQPPGLNQTANITCFISSQTDAPNTTANIILPEGIDVVSGSTSWYGNINGGQVEFSVTIKPVTTGNFTIECVATSTMDDNSSFGNRDFLYLSVSENNTTASQDPPSSEPSIYCTPLNSSEIPSTNLSQEEIANMIKPELTNFTENQTSNTIQVKCSGAKSPGSIKIQGYIYYNDPELGTMPAKFLLAKFYDDGDWDRFFSPDGYGELMGTYVVDSNGYFESDWISNEDPWPEGGTRDVYVMFVTETTAATVRYYIGWTYKLVTSTYWDVSDGIVDVGAWTTGTHRAFRIYEYLMQGWSYMVNGPPSWTPPHVNAIWETGHNADYWCGGGTTHYHYEGLSIHQIHINDEHADSPDVILHEYGHHIMLTAYGDWMPPNIQGGHNWNEEIHVNQAWTEGWADFFFAPVREWVGGDAIYNDYLQGFSVDIETLPSWIAVTGDDNEGRVAAALYDIYDTTNDGHDTFNGGFKLIWDVISSQTDNNFAEFWDAWKARYTDSYTRHYAKMAIYQNTIYYNNAPTCTVTNLGTQWYKGTITLSAAVSDTDTEDTSYLQVEFEYSTDHTNWISIGTTSQGVSSIMWDTSGITDNSVWVRARALDGMEYSSWDECDSSFKVDNTAPTITDVQAGDDTWRSSNTGYYNVEFDDSGGSKISYFQTKVTTGTSQTGTILQDWTTVVSGINFDGWQSYITLLDSTWSAMLEGTNYVSIRVYDNAGNSATMSDVFYVKKDTVAPTVTDYQAGDDTWRNSAGTTYNVDFSDSTSLLNYAQYRIWSSAGQSGTMLKDWTDIFTNLGSSSYTTNWQIDFSACQEGINYVSVRVYDNAGKSTTITDVFYVKKDTAAPIIMDSQVGDNTWRNSNNGYYNVDFSDSAMLSYFQTKVTTSTNQGGTVLQDWTTVVSGINSNSYTTNWQLLASTWTAMQEGTNYVSVRVYDCAGFSATMNEVFYVKKDVTTPSVIDYQAGDDTWRNSNNGYYDVDFGDTGGSMLSYFQTKVTTSTNQGGTVLQDWTTLVSGINSNSYTTNWQLLSSTWSAMQQGTNYVYVKVFDNAGKFYVSSDYVFYVKKDTTPPTITLNTPPILENSEYLHASGCNLYYSDLMGSTAQSFTIQGTASDSQSGLSYGTASTAFDDSQTSDTTPSSWSWTYTVVSSNSGSSTITVTIYDNLNNQASQTFYYYEDLQMPYAPSLTSPTDGATIIARKPTFSWSQPTDLGDSGIQYYYLEIDTSNSFSSANLVQRTVDTNQYTLDIDLDFTTYYWHIRAVDNVGNVGDWSTPKSFTVCQFYRVDLEPESQSGIAPPGWTYSFMITVTNMGNGWDTITLTTTLGTLDAEQVSLDYGQSTGIVLTLTASNIEGITLTATVRGDSGGVMDDDVSCSVTSYTGPPYDPHPYPPPPVKRYRELPIDSPIFDGIGIGIWGDIALPGTILPGDLDLLPDGKDFCINKIINPILQPQPGVFPSPWYCEGNNIYQIYYVNISNPFESTVIVNLSFYGVPEGWGAYLSDYSITLEPGEYIIISLIVVIPQTTTAAQATIWVLGIIQDYNYLFEYGVNVTVGQVPVAIARVQSPYQIILEDNILIFNASYSYDPDGTIFGYEWDFGDGTNGTGMKVEHSYENTGSYVVTLIVRDNYNLTNTTTIVVSVEHHSFEVNVQQINPVIKPGETAVYMIEIRNTGTISDTYVLRMINLGPFWSYPDNVYIGISAGGSITLYLEVTIPSDYPLMENTTYSFTVTLSCTHDQTVMSNAPLTYTADETLTVIATKESKIRYMINEVEELMTTLDDMDIPQGVKNSLKSKLENALDKLNTALDDILNGDENHADKMLKCAQNKLNAFINAVEAQRGKKISEEDADILVSAVQTIIEHIDDTIATPL